MSWIPSVLRRDRGNTFASRKNKIQALKEKELAKNLAVILT